MNAAGHDSGAGPPSGRGSYTAAVTPQSASVPDKPSYAWLALVTLLWLAVCAWPLATGLRATNDDLKFVRVAQDHASLFDAVVHAWRTSPGFRPVEIALGRLSDPITLESWATVPVQALGLAALLWALWPLCRLAVPGWRAAWGVASIVVLMSPATTCSLWQMDTASQTWTAALGAWSIVLAWGAWRRASEPGAERASVGTAVLLGAVFAVGCSIKETFYGWSFGLGGVIAAMVAWQLVRHRAAALRLSLQLLPVVALPLAHIALRATTGSLGGHLGQDETSRYQVELGSNLVVNVALSIGGVFGAGPFHLVMNDDAHPLLRLLPFAAMVSAVFAVLGVAVLAMVGKRLPACIAPGALAFAVIASAGSMVPTLLMGSVSELYGLGANIGAALLIAAAFAALWCNQAPDERLMARGLAVLTGLVFAAVGVYGVASRAEHFRIVWQATDEVNRRILAFREGLAPSPADSKEFAGIVHFATSCVPPKPYGQYVISPLQATNVDVSFAWLNRKDPERDLAFSLGEPAGAIEARELVVDCSTLPRHGGW